MSDLWWVVWYQNGLGELRSGPYYWNQAVQFYVDFVNSATFDHMLMTQPEYLPYEDSVKPTWDLFCLTWYAIGQIERSNYVEYKKDMAIDLTAASRNWNRKKYLEAQERIKELENELQLLRVTDGPPVH